MIANNAMGYTHQTTWTEKQRIALAACTLVCYDHGYKKVYGSSSVHLWMEKIVNYMKFGGEKNVLANNHSGKTSYMESVEQRNPTYLHQLFRHATTTLGDNATFEEASQLTRHSPGLHTMSSFTNADQSTMN